MPTLSKRPGVQRPPCSEPAPSSATKSKTSAARLPRSALRSSSFSDARTLADTRRCSVAKRFPPPCDGSPVIVPHPESVAAAKRRINGRRRHRFWEGRDFMAFQTGIRTSDRPITRTRNAKRVYHSGLVYVLACGVALTDGLASAPRRRDIQASGQNRASFDGPERELRRAPHDFGGPPIQFALFDNRPVFRPCGSLQRRQAPGRGSLAALLA